MTKALLWQGVFGFSNFEGMTLGPRLTGSGELAQRQDVFGLILRGLSTSL